MIVKSRKQMRLVIVLLLQRMHLATEPWFKRTCLVTEQLCSRMRLGTQLSRSLVRSVVPGRCSAF